MTRFLVTGGTGFVGAQATASLRRAGHGVVAAGRAEADLLEPGAAARLVEQAQAEVLVHLAWCTEHGAFWAAPDNDAWVDASLELLGAFARAGGTRAVVGGTCVEPWPETSRYAAAKDRLRRAAEEQAAAAGLALAWGRIHATFGPGEDPRRLVPSLVRGIARGERVPTTAGRQVRDFLYVEDLGDAVAALASSPVTGIVDLGTGNGITVHDFTKRIVELMGGSGRLDHGALPEREGEPPVLVADARRLREDVGFAERIGTDEGLRRTVAWWVEADA
jgi:nucleoside-diphosphate-sugar epimerase